MMIILHYHKGASIKPLTKVLKRRNRRAGIAGKAASEYGGLIWRVYWKISRFFVSLAGGRNPTWLEKRRGEKEEEIC